MRRASSWLAGASSALANAGEAMGSAIPPITVADQMAAA
jgi:hypothetical protein